MPIVIPVPRKWAKAFDVGVRYFLLNIVLWVISRFWLHNSVLSLKQTLVMAFGSVSAVFFYYLVVKPHLLDFPARDGSFV